ncbi:XkdW family protein [Paenibacillus sp. YN15]|uniref:XkdW family protein n=1 Tax=Paenibacillus sp. YN15 TaxID=1742774 RepID=UPI000DCC5448|nr:XkdW family protein [Paenibacillus sp. YN15]RAU93217.1 hypothetical protein DQG13_26190 [Paenibacillus sp. YN15]
MDIFKTLSYLYPKASPLVDYIVQDDGPTPVLRPGVDGLFRFQLRPPKEDETEEIEGIHYRMVIDYNRLTEGEDYDIVERGPYIAVWNLPDPQPTEEELLAAWDAIKDMPPEPVPPAEAERIAVLETDSIHTMIAVTEAFEAQQAADGQRGQEATSTMLALTEAYEIILQQQDTMAALMARVEALEAKTGGES